MMQLNDNNRYETESSSTKFRPLNEIFDRENYLGQKQLSTSKDVDGEANSGNKIMRIGIGMNSS